MAYDGDKPTGILIGNLTPNFSGSTVTQYDIYITRVERSESFTLHFNIRLTNI